MSPSQHSALVEGCGGQGRGAQHGFTASRVQAPVPKLLQRGLQACPSGYVLVHLGAARGLGHQLTSKKSQAWSKG